MTDSKICMFWATVFQFLGWLLGKIAWPIVVLSIKLSDIGHWFRGEDWRDD